ncbi:MULTISPECIES: GGDEF domain-containing protein [Halomonadaceae]|uniref:diguanylate cyclase n=1 Tax=Vreelandella piezotolerans TaxID=2609667 RepID=A0ABQ6XB93_9GAMM|nr:MULTISPECIES: GGDEF domain-containing protein [Halomonas]MCG7577814.1 diguanylate cyclase [Halomonas sp. MMH1-48]MCG7591100.1 diguanylate cyclase [Halomonas sp. McD50-5]MCG7604880.1 diguanylate cyclase [Halomonas sp. MM17-34]MCG7614154.1 diguanylate cyclase [Halomonas sp. MM17-29]MCG7617236.1 diguanylate cyclase [Halomonas sp. McD50-4]MCG7620999.1 diguanylate cyclase [Halomonas sp. DSH1-27]
MSITKPYLASGRLTLKQALLTLLIAILISLVSGSIELLGHASSMREDVQKRTLQQLAIVNGAAAEAAFQLNPDLAHQIAFGLFSNSDIAHVAIRDDFGRALAEFYPTRPAAASWLSQRLFGDIVNHDMPLRYYIGSDMPDATVGDISLTLDADYLTQEFLERSYEVVGRSVVEAFLLSGLVIALFHIFITRPLLKVHAAITQTDPARPGQWPKPSLKGHHDDELGHLVESLDHLLNAFQSGLEQRDHLHQLSQYDGLTGVANRRHFDMFIAQQWQWAHRAKRPLSVIFIDIDNFKEFNDHYGHAMGDDTLRAVATALNQCIDPSRDLLARYGGEEFICVLPGTASAGALDVANCLRQAVLSLAIPHVYSSTHSHLTASMGVASMSAERPLSTDDLLSLADQQLYLAKRRGRNRVEIHERPA